MLSRIGRAAIQRLGAGAPHVSTNRSILFLQPVDTAVRAQPPNINQSSFSLQRLYSTTIQATRPKTKTTAATPKPKTKAAAPKKPANKATKKKSPAKLKAKPTPKPKKKVLTDLQKQKLESTLRNAKLKALKLAALTPPKAKPANAWTVLFTEYVSNNPNHSRLTNQAKAAAAKYKSLTPDELEKYTRTAIENKLANEAAYKEWIQSHTPEQIRVANNARLALNRKDSGVAHKYFMLRDPRIPKRPMAAWIIFGQEKWASGDLNGMAGLNGTPLILKEWKELSPSQRKPYEDQHLADTRRYAEEYKRVFNRDPDFMKLEQKPAA